jgi:hypothetical protein
MAGLKEGLKTEFLRCVAGNPDATSCFRKMRIFGGHAGRMCRIPEAPGRPECLASVSPGARIKPAVGCRRCVNGRRHTGTGRVNAA